MKLFVFLVILAIIAVTTQGFQKSDDACTVCKRTIRWVRANPNIKNSIQSDKKLPPGIVKVIVSDVHAYTICVHLALCKIVVEDDHPKEDENRNEQHHHHHHHHHRHNRIHHNHPYKYEHIEENPKPDQ